MNPLLELKKLGQSVWYDSIRRGLVTSGELKRMISEYGLSGVTSNPTIFDKAVEGTDEYDSEIERLALKGLSGEEIARGIMVEDIRLAAGSLLSVHRKTSGRDGFVSIEVSAALARDAKATIEEALALQRLVDMPNIMVKVPGTAEGLFAIEELTYRGLNINITLLFSVDRYAEAANAYIKGLERRAAEGKPLSGISSVASFFVSRVDTLADRTLEKMAAGARSRDEATRLEGLIGKVAVANAKVAYLKYNEIFGGERFRRMEALGASRQRLLWASTGTKDPRYPDTKYVDGLIERGTVNTMPLHTMLAYYDHGRPRADTLSEGPDEARKVFSELRELGFDYKKMTDELEEDGVKTFAESGASLLKSIGERKKALLEKRGAPAVYGFAGFEKPVSDALDGLMKEGFLDRLWAKDPTLWKSSMDDRRLIKNSLGWLTLPDVMGSHVEAINSFVRDVQKAAFKHAVVLGMGGSSLAPLVFANSFGHIEGFPKLLVLDSTDPWALRSIEASIDPARTLFIVSSKSGTTIEPLSFFEYFRKKLEAIKGPAAGENFAAITDPGTALEGFAKKYGFRKVFLNPADIGGRYSALSFFGLVPAALSGVDIKRLLGSAASVSAAIHPCMPETANQVVTLGAALGILGNSGRDKLTFIMSPEIATFGLWIEQLIAESTGKEGKGLVPITGEPLGEPSSYGDDRVFIYIGTNGPDEKTRAALNRLKDAGHPAIIFIMNGLYGLGAEFLRWEVATAVAGQILGINPFDQPDVELAKKLTIARLGSKGRGKAMTPPGVEIDGAGFKAYFGKTAAAGMHIKGHDFKSAVRDYIRLVKKGDYVGVLAYYNPEDPEVRAGLAGFRAALREMTKAATQFGYGPRYLHSTGQLHKGGAKSGVFFILCHRGDGDMPVPGKEYSFSDLELSQAFGDMEALDSKGVRVVLMDLADPTSGPLREAGEAIKNAFEGR